MRHENRKEVCPGGPRPVLPRPGPRPSARVWWWVSPSLPPLPNSRLCQTSVPRISSRCFLNTVGPQITRRLEAPHSTQCKIYTPLLTPQKLNYSWPSAAGEGWTPAPAPSSAPVRRSSPSYKPAGATRAAGLGLGICRFLAMGGPAVRNPGPRRIRRQGHTAFRDSRSGNPCRSRFRRAQTSASDGILRCAGRGRERLWTEGRPRGPPHVRA